MSRDLFMLSQVARLSELEYFSFQRGRDLLQTATFYNSC
jgi:hypothetical protein